MKYRVAEILFTDFDTNNNEFIEQDEFTAGHEIRFKQRAAEGRKLKHAGDLDTKFAEIDTDHDGRVSRAEFAAHQASHRNMHMSKQSAKKQS